MFPLFCTVIIFLLEALQVFWKVFMGSGTDEYKHIIWGRSRKVKWVKIA